MHRKTLILLIALIAPLTMGNTAADVPAGDEQAAITEAWAAGELKPRKAIHRLEDVVQLQNRLIATLTAEIAEIKAEPAPAPEPVEDGLDWLHDCLYDATVMRMSFRTVLLKDFYAITQYCETHYR